MARSQRAERVLLNEDLVKEAEDTGCASGLNPLFTIDGHQYVMATQVAVAVKTSSLSRPVANLDQAMTRSARLSI